MNRHILCASYLLLVIIGTRSLITHLILEGELFDPSMCGEDVVLEDCKKQQVLFNWGWFALDTLWQFYLFHQLATYAKRPLLKWHDSFAEGDDYEKGGQPLV